jgi:DNA-binding NtrC family response regulator
MPCARQWSIESEVSAMADLLIVDDDVETGDLLADLLRDEGHEVRVGRNGRDGLALVAERRPDVVLLDVEMPVLTGPEMSYAMFLRDMGLERIPIVLVSGVLDLRRVAASVGTPYFLSKPYDMPRLLGMLGKALAERCPPHPALQAAPYAP